MTLDEIRFVTNLDDGQARLRKSHLKSRSGCMTCKRRKVKCDEKSPICGACERRDEECIRRHTTRARSAEAATRRIFQIDLHHSASPSASSRSTSRKATEIAPALPLGRDASVTSLQLRMFYHFESVTIHTLILGTTTWQRLLPLAFEVSTNEQHCLSTEWLINWLA